MQYRETSIFFIISALIAINCSCAKISSPSGGLKDKIPPVVVKSAPLNGSKNFKGNKLEIFFNEYVVLDNINDKFIVSPPMRKKPRVLIKGKSVVVEFEEKLKENTTYTLYFQDAIKDLNEGNILKDYKFVMSTGQVIDSLSVTGNIYNAFNLEVPEKTNVLMYSELADSFVVKHLPDYIARVDADGYFRIDNVRPGIYKLYGLKDGDNSKNYNLPDEDFAYMDSAIVISPSRHYIVPPVVMDTTNPKKVTGKTLVSKKESGIVNNSAGKNTSVKKDTASVKKTEEPVVLTGRYPLYIFSGTKKAHYLSGSKRDNKFQMTYILSLPPDTMKFEFSIPGVKDNTYLTESSRERDTLKVWLTDSTLYSQREISTIVKFPFTDTLGVTGYKQDTILMRYLAPKIIKTTKVKKIKRTPFTFESNISTGSLKPGQNIVFRSKTPFRQPDTSRIRLYELIQSDKKKIPYFFVKDSINSCKYYLKTKQEVKKKYLFIADSAAFGNVFGEYSDSVGIKFSIKDPDSFQKLTLDIKNYDSNMIVQLLDKTEKLVAENYLKKEGKTVFSLLDPGKYRVRVIYDLNGDGKWTTGDFDKHRQPEPVSYFVSEIELRSGFELEQTWDVGVKNFKDARLREKRKGDKKIS